MKLVTCLAPFYWSTIDPYSSLKFQIFSYTCYYYILLYINLHMEYKVQQQRKRSLISFCDGREF